MNLKLVSDVLASLARIEKALQIQRKEIKKMALDITALQNAVAAEVTVEQKAIALLATLTAQIQTLITEAGNAVDPAALQALVDSMTASQAALAAAVASATPAA
jgi:hypothetical protein